MCVLFLLVAFSHQSGWWFIRLHLQLLTALQDHVFLNQRSTNACVFIEERPLRLWVRSALGHYLYVKDLSSSSALACRSLWTIWRYLQVWWHLELWIERLLWIRTVRRCGLIRQFEFTIVPVLDELVSLKVCQLCSKWSSSGLNRFRSRRDGLWDGVPCNHMLLGTRSPFVAAWRLFVYFVLLHSYDFSLFWTVRN